VIRAVSLLLWLRLALLTPRLLAGDLPGMIRRLRRGHRGDHLRAEPAP